MTHTTDLIRNNEIENYRKDLVALLMDSVNGGASVGFIPPLSETAADQYWTSIKFELENGSKDLMVLKDKAGAVIAAVQLAYPPKANASHRAEVQKLFVHSRVRRKGYAKILMNALEVAARQKDKILLFLDTRKGDPSEALYMKLGYEKAGEIPQYARSANGNLHTTVFLYKLIDK